jgi:hypothetical protein
LYCRTRTLQYEIHIERYIGAPEQCYAIIIVRLDSLSQHIC